MPSLIGTSPMTLRKPKIKPPLISAGSSGKKISREVGDKLLVPFHILARGSTGLLFICRVVPGSGEQSLIVIAHFGTNNH